MSIVLTFFVLGMDYFAISSYTVPVLNNYTYMAKRDRTLGVHPKSNKSHKTEKRLAIKREMLATRAGITKKAK